MKKTTIVLVLILITLLTSCFHKHEWEFKVSNNCKYPSAFAVHNDFSPDKVNITITGELSDSAKFYANIINGGERDTTWIQPLVYIDLPKGKVNYQARLFDYYVHDLNFLYVPKDGANSGNLTIKVEVY